jgi:hypothetical protein
MEQLTARDKPPHSKYLLLGAIFLFAGWLAAFAGIVPILGPIFAYFAPDLFLFGLVFVSIWGAKVFLPNANNVAVGGLAVFLSVVCGLNTRLPTIVSDVWNGNGNQTQVISRLEGIVGQPIHFAIDTPEISARQNAYSYPRPACHGDGCFQTDGFRTPYPWIETDYWHEKVMDVTLAAGFSMANQGEPAPTLTIKQSKEENVSTIHLELADATGKTTATYDGRYRVRFPFETRDEEKSDGGPHALALQFLLHGNFLNRLAPIMVRSAANYPLSSFLKIASQLSHPQGKTLGLFSKWSSRDGEPPSIKVVLEVLEEKTYDPVWIIKEEPDSSVSRWSEISWDKTRGVRCQTLLKPETIGAPLMQTWHLFVNDPSGRKKVRYTGTAICDPDAIWFEDYVIERGRMVLTKYSVTGDFIYRISFEQPPAPYGYAGALLMSTFKSSDGFLNFEWWNTSQSGRDRHIKRSMKVRIKEPQDSMGKP